MKPENRAIGMGLFFAVYFLVMTLSPPIAGWLFDLTTDQVWPMLFAGALFLLTAVANAAFRATQKRLLI
jgi:MFS family permease